MMETYTIKKVSDQLEVEKKTLKQWEKLLGSYLTIERVDGARVYTEEQIELFNDIKQLFDEQCTLDEVKEYVQLLIKEQEEQEHLVMESEVAVSKEDEPAQLKTAKKENVIDFQEHSNKQVKQEKKKTADKQENIPKNKQEKIPPIPEARLATEEEKQTISASIEEPKPNDLVVNEKELLQGELVEAVRRYEDVFEVLDTFKADLLKEMREGMRNEVREEIVGEVKRELEKSATQTVEMVESVGAYISESSERSARDVENMSKKIIRSNEKSFDEVTSLIEDYSTIAEEKTEDMRLFMKDVMENADESSKEMQYLLDRFSSNSTVAMNQVKFMVEKLNNSSTNTTEELRDLIDSMNEERVYYLKEMEKERKLHRQSVAEREEMFSDFVQTFRQTAAADMKRKRKWWKLFLS
ncbi:helix-turn-helix domain-containing protein [Priestia megaterium]|uniref:helix-turn-helix domain-containing protein n=1 Tax=Priestia megaterium TaxID=1404 RepID=UPI001ADFE4D7|nr:MerR family transcriptional regulator [Priestia megaterium]